jgi:hypothetical protein
VPDSKFFYLVISELFLKNHLKKIKFNLLY